jgi:hypothetical protein
MEMTYTEIINAIKENNRKNFVVTYTNGKTANKRLFIATSGHPCEFAYKSRKRGYILNTNEILSVVAKDKKVKNGIELCRENLHKVVKYLSASGFWQKMLKGAEYLLTLTDEELLAMSADYKVYNEKMDLVADQNAWWFGYECFIHLFGRKIRTMRCSKYDSEFYKSMIAESMKTRTDYRSYWRCGYDNSVEIKYLGTDDASAWYSEEYVNCANGHYYFLLDESHILFGEND